MKREREEELAPVVAYFQELRASDANAGNMAVQLLSLEEVFEVMFRDRPVSMLRLLVTAKQLYGVLARMPGFFRQLLDRVIVKETGEPDWAYFVWDFEVNGDFRALIGRTFAFGGKLKRDFQYTFNAIMIELDLKLRATENGLDHADVSRRSDRTGRPVFIGNGARIVQIAEKHRYTAMCEIIKYRGHLYTTHWANASLLSPEQRAKLARLYTAVHPFALGPFALLDTRRQHLYQSFMRIVNVSSDDTINVLTRVANNDADWDGADPIDMFDRLTSIKYLLPERPVTSGDARDHWNARIDGFLAEFIDATLDTVVNDHWTALCAVTTDSEIFISSKGSEGARAALALVDAGLPAPGHFLTIEPYRDAIFRRYHDTAVARRALLGELEFLDVTRGTGYVEQQFGQPHVAHQ